MKYATQVLLPFLDAKDSLGSRDILSHDGENYEKQKE